MGVYYFVLATVIATIPMIINFKVTIGKIRQNPETFQQVAQKFIIINALIEFIPIILIVLGFIQEISIRHISELYVPGLIVISIYACALLIVMMEENFDRDEQITVFRVLSLFFISAIPLLSIIGMILQLM